MVVVVVVVDVVEMLLGLVLFSHPNIFSSSFFTSPSCVLSSRNADRSGVA